MSTDLYLRVKYIWSDTGNEDVLYTDIEAGSQYRPIRNILGQPTVMRQVQEIREQLNADLESIQSSAEEAFQDLRSRLASIEEMLARPYKFEKFQEARRLLEEMEPEITRRRNSITDSLSQRLGQAYLALAPFNQQPFKVRTLTIRIMMVKAISRAWQSMNDELDQIQRRRDSLMALRATRIPELRANLLVANEQGSKEIKERTRQIEELNQELGQGDDLS